MSMVPVRYRVVSTRPETGDTATLTLAPVDRPIAAPRPGQFTMLYAFGVGEVPISVSGSSSGNQLAQTIRAVGAVSRHLVDRAPGDVLGVRGPYGTAWGVDTPPGADLVVMAGGIGLAPLRPVIRHAAAHRDRYRTVTVLIGARTPVELLYPQEHPLWRDAGIDVRVTVDRAGADWTGHVGVVTTLLGDIEIDPDRVRAFVCGPEAMMRFSAQALIRAGVPAPVIEVSMERNMRCGDGLCGHCQLGPLMVCRDGPVIDFASAEPLMTCREL